MMTPGMVIDKLPQFLVAAEVRAWEFFDQGVFASIDQIPHKANTRYHGIGIHLPALAAGQSIAFVKIAEADIRPFARIALTQLDVARSIGGMRF